MSADDPSDLRLAIATPGIDVYSETFVRAQIEKLPCHVDVLYGGALPTTTPGHGELFRYHTAGYLRKGLAKLSMVATHSSLGDRQRRALARFLVERNIDVVLAQYGITGVEMHPICEKVRIPLVVHFLGYDAYKHAVVSSYSERYQRMFHYCDAVVAGSRDMVAQLIRLGAPAEKVVYSPLGVDLSVFRKGIPSQSDPLFVCVGRFVEKKGQTLTILAFRKVAAAVADARLVFIGDGPLEETGKILVAALGLSGRVDFLGAQDHATVADWFSRSRAGVLHSLVAPSGDSEGTCIAVLEAAACGRPVVATRHGGIVESVTDGITGFLVAEGDFDAMADRMIDLARSPELADRMGAAGRAHMEAGYAMEIWINRLWKVIEKSARSKVPGSARWVP